jgi:hypothetical protein
MEGMATGHGHDLVALPESIQAHRAGRVLLAGVSDGKSGNGGGRSRRLTLEVRRFLRVGTCRERDREGDADEWGNRDEESGLPSGAVGARPDVRLRGHVEVMGREELKGE